MTYGPRIAGGWGLPCPAADVGIGASVQEGVMWEPWMTRAVVVCGVALLVLAIEVAVIGWMDRKR